jgi:hypothetical protein
MKLEGLEIQEGEKRLLSFFWGVLQVKFNSLHEFRDDDIVSATWEESNSSSGGVGDLDGASFG